MRYDQDATIRAGESAELAIGITNVTGLNLTGCEGRYYAGDSVMGNLLFSTDGSVTVVDAKTASMLVTIDPETTRGFPVGWLSHEARLMLANGTSSTVMVGRLRVDPPSLAGSTGATVARVSASLGEALEGAT